MTASLVAPLALSLPPSFTASLCAFRARFIDTSDLQAACLWLKGLPKLVPTNIVEGREARVHRMPPGPNRWKERSRTFEGIAQAMADQWGRAIAQAERAA